MPVSAKHVLTILAVEDHPRAVAFYSRALGWRLTVETPVYAEFVDPGGMRLGLYQREGFGRNTGEAPAITPPGRLAPTELYLEVDNVAEALAELERAGARRLSPPAPRPWGDEVAYAADPDGKVLAVARPHLASSA